MELICGKCAQEKQLPLEERIDIALTRLSGNTYICPHCKAQHALRHIRATLNNDAPESVPLDEEQLVMFEVGNF